MKLKKLCITAGCLLAFGGVAFSSVLALSETGYFKSVSATVTNGQLFVGGVDINKASSKKVIGGDGYAQLSGTTLTLNNYTYEGDGYTWGEGYTKYYAGILYKGSDVLTIKITGENSIRLTHSSSGFRSYGIAFFPNQSSSDYKLIDMNITGSGSLYCESGRGNVAVGFCSNTVGKIKFNGPTCTFKGGDVNPAYTSMSSYGFTDEESMWSPAMTIESGDLTFIGGSGGYSYGLTVENSFMMTGGTLTCLGGESTASSGFSVGMSCGTSTLFYGGHVFLGSEYGYGFRSQTADNDAPSFQDYSSTKKLGGVCIWGEKGALHRFNASRVQFSSLAWTNKEGTGYGTIVKPKTNYDSSVKRIYIAGIRYDAANIEVDYDGQEHGATVTSTTANTTITYSDDDSTYSSTAPTWSAIGDHTTYFKIDHEVEPGEIQYPTVKGSLTLTIVPATPVVTLPTAKTLYYTGQSQELLTAGSSNDGVFQYRLGTTGEWTTTVPSATEMDSYTVYYKFIGNPGYADIPETAINVSILQPEISDVEVEVIGQYVYTGSPLTPTVDATATTVGSVDYTFAYSKTNGGPYGEMPSYTEAGTHEVFYEVTAENHIPAHGSFNFVIGKAEGSIGTVPAAVSGLHYTGEPQALLTAGESTDGTIKYRFADSEEWLDMVPSATDVGEYVIVYKLFGDNDHSDSEEYRITVSIIENDKTELISAIEEAQKVYDEIKESYPKVAKTLKKAIDSAKEVKNNPNVTVKQIEDAIKSLKTAIQKAKDGTRDVVSDEASGVTVQTSDGSAIPTNINLKVEVRTDVKAEKGSAEYSKIQEMLESNEKISNVFEIKLIKTEGDVEKEIQPSEIKPGMKLIIHINLPDGLDTEGLRVLHIHNNGDMEFVEEFTIENGQIVFEVSSLSELAFVTPYTPGLPGWAIALIIVGAVLLACLLCLLLLFLLFPRYIKDEKKNKVVRVVRLFPTKDKYVLLGANCKFYKLPKSSVYKTKAEAEKH